ncbi:DUF4870 domain-containing protein [Flavobacterium muglaense]|uniref:DUF4870 domain-containing protein n=1 Tax=Flavobacterium muglaense TaxID=2764716 RepID=A0A923MX39_9FLAO|nr:DUF4870 domain-containing protein [Flavobacterium muglaense]MBC5836837.1 DUF4870 domain-containing protein [Flavobacterium muglaense]MBC5843366.1 DUF4870 domain-containing protein [Flavobacterium muglaense]
MNNKTVAIVSYITIIGWLISYFSYKDRTPKSALVNYHLKQSLGVACVGLIVGVAINVIALIVPALASVLSLISLLVLVLWIFGIINAMNEVEKPVPVIGAIFENKFGFIK